MSDTPKYEVGGRAKVNGVWHKITGVWPLTMCAGGNPVQKSCVELGSSIISIDLIAEYEPPKPKEHEWLPKNNYDMLIPRDLMSMRECLNAWLTEKYGKPPAKPGIRFTEADRMEVLKQNPNALWLAMDEDGDAFSYDVAINPVDEQWIVYERCNLKIHPSLENYADDWRKSLIDLTRPVGGEA